MRLIQFSILILLFFVYQFSDLHAAEIRLMLKGNHFEILYEEDSKVTSFHSRYAPIDTQGMYEVMEPLWQEHSASLLYIHCLFGNAPGYSEVAEEVVMKHFHKDQLLIFVDWGTLNPFYGAQRKTAQSKAQHLAAILSLFPEPHELSIIAHSMGAELSRCAIQAMDTRALEHWILLTPDILLEDFRADLPKIIASVNQTSIFTSSDDVVLWASSLLNDADILGPDDIESEKIQLFDLGNLGCKVAKHVNWLVCDGVQEKVKEQLFGEIAKGDLQKYK